MGNFSSFPNDIIIMRIPPKSIKISPRTRHRRNSDTRQVPIFQTPTKFSKLWQPGNPEEKQVVQLIDEVLQGEGFFTHHLPARTDVDWRTRNYEGNRHAIANFYKIQCAAMKSRVERIW